MVTNPLDYVEPFGKAGASGFTFHVEVSRGWLSCSFFSYPAIFLTFLIPSFVLWEVLMVFFTENWRELVQKIKSNGMRPAVALKPGTPIEEVYPLV